MSRLLLRTTAAALGALALSAGAALAHHSFAMFDFTRTVQLKGVVREFQWTNPHVVLWLVPEPGQGPGQGAAADSWTIELTSPGNLTRLGWSKRSLKPGDRVTVEVNPLRDGKSGGAFRKAVLADGQVLTASLRDQERPKAP